MPKRNPMLERIELKYKAYYEEKFNRNVAMLLQVGQDAGMMAAHDVFGMGEKRALKFAKAYSEHFADIIELLDDDLDHDKKYEYTKDTVDKKLKEICGSNFDPWEVRYQDESL